MRAADASSNWNLTREQEQARSLKSTQRLPGLPEMFRGFATTCEIAETQILDRLRAITDDAAEIRREIEHQNQRL